MVTMIVAIACANAIPAMAATYRTKNFIINAPSREFAEQVGKAAEVYREKLAVAWLGKPLPGNWSSPCPVTVRVGQLGAGGATSFQFDRGQVFGWRMNIQGSEERILDSVLPHEISHMIFASYFRRPLPRWADEGAATLIEHESERRRQQLLLNEVMSDGTKFPLRTLLGMKEYPQDQRRILTLYAQGYSLADYLIQKQGRRTFLKFLNDADRTDWDSAIRKNYKLNNTASLETNWNNWVMAGSPRLNVPEGELLAENTDGSAEPTVVRGQSPEASAGTAVASSLGAAVSKSDAPLFGADASDADAVPMTNEEPSVSLEPDQETESPAAAVEASATKSGLQDYQLRGRRAVVLAGWEPAPLADRTPDRRRVSTPESPRLGERPPFPGETNAGKPERPPFIDDSQFAMSN